MNWCYRHSSEWGWRNSAPVRSGLRVVVQPTGEQITLAEAKRYCHVDDDLGGSPPANIEDADFLDWIVEAREYLENETGRALVPQTFELTTNAWPTYGVGSPAVLLPMSPIASLGSVVYLDGSGAPITLAGSAYTLTNWSDFEPTWLYPAVDTTWPTAQGAQNAITIRYNAGYTLPTDSPNDRPLPRAFKSAMRMYIHDKWRHRGEQTDEKLQDVKIGIDAVIRKYKLDLGIA